MSDLDLDNLRKLDAAATPGPWEHRPGIDPPGDIIAPHLGESGPRPFITRISAWGRSADAALIAAMRNALPALLADHARLVVERDLARDEHGYWHRVAMERGAQVTAMLTDRDAARAELTAERDAHQATRDALARARAEVRLLTVTKRDAVEMPRDELSEMQVDAARILAERDAAHAEATRLAQELDDAQINARTAQEIHNDSAAQWAAEVERLQEVNVTLLGDEVKLSRLLVDERDAAYAEVRAAKAEVARLRGLVERACNLAGVPAGAVAGRAAAIRKEAAGE